MSTNTESKKEQKHICFASTKKEDKILPFSSFKFENLRSEAPKPKEGKSAADTSKYNKFQEIEFPNYKTGEGKNDRSTVYFKLDPVTVDGRSLFPLVDKDGNVNRPTISYTHMSSNKKTVEFFSKFDDYFSTPEFIKEKFGEKYLKSRRYNGLVSEPSELTRANNEKNKRVSRNLTKIPIYFKGNDGDRKCLTTFRRQESVDGKLKYVNVEFKTDEEIYNGLGIGATLSILAEVFKFYLENKETDKARTYGFGLRAIQVDFIPGPNSMVQKVDPAVFEGIMNDDDESQEEINEDEDSGEQKKKSKSDDSEKKKKKKQVESEDEDDVKPKKKKKPVDSDSEEDKPRKKSKK